MSLVIGYALLGATWLVMKTEGDLRDRAYHLSWLLLIAMLGAIGAVSIATPFLHVQYTHRWFTWPNIILTAPVPIAVAGVTVLLLRSLANKYDYQPFFLTLALFALSYAGLGISMYPYIVPQSITIWQAAAPANSQVFMLFGVAVLIPLILGYTAWAYWVFRGKVKPRAAIIDRDQAQPPPTDTASAVVRHPVARRRRHRGADFVLPEAVDRTEIRRPGPPMNWAVGGNRRHFSHLSASFALNLPSSWP